MLAEIGVCSGVSSRFVMCWHLTLGHIPWDYPTCIVFTGGSCNKGLTVQIECVPPTLPSFVSYCLLSMKIPVSESKIKSRRKVISPYRPCTRVETDAIPIHQQSFPLRKRVQVKPTTVVELLDEDLVPIHRQRFPLTTAAPDFDKTGDRGVAVTVAVCQEHESYLTSVESIVPERQEQKIRNLDAVVGRYVTRHELPLRYPLPCPHAKSGDLYIHRYDGNRGIQIWVRDVDCWIANVVDGHHHPVLPDYRLYIADGTGPTNTWDMSFVFVQQEMGYIKAARLVESRSFPPKEFSNVSLFSSLPGKNHDAQEHHIQDHSKKRVQKYYYCSTLSNTHGGCTSLLTQFEYVHEISIDANPELAELVELLDCGVLVPPPSKPVQPKLPLYDVLMTVILLLFKFKSLLDGTTCIEIAKVYARTLEQAVRAPLTSSSVVQYSC
ncbi:hypothetical protein EDD15DRAFT_2192096 [Pisolithus albus]|nr:hypothetical protein EDD15DRAFT_2192096 [Pisolithus albus]